MGWVGGLPEAGELKAEMTADREGIDEVMKNYKK
jgi:hypothetical protein